MVAYEASFSQDVCPTNLSCYMLSVPKITCTRSLGVWFVPTAHCQFSSLRMKMIVLIVLVVFMAHANARHNKLVDQMSVVSATSFGNDFGVLTNCGEL